MKNSIQLANNIMVRAYNFRANNDCGYLLSDQDVVMSISIGADCTPDEAEKLFNDNYPSIKSNRGVYLTRIEEITMNLAVGLVVRTLKGTTPTHEELKEYCVIQAKSYNIEHVEILIRRCEYKINIRMPIFDTTSCMINVATL